MRDNWRECVFFLTAVLKARDGGETVLLFPVYFLVPVSSSLNSLTKTRAPGTPSNGFAFTITNIITEAVV